MKYLKSDYTCVLDYYEQNSFWSHQVVSKYIKGVRVSILLNLSNEYCSISFNGAKPVRYYFWFETFKYVGMKLDDDYYVLLKAVKCYNWENRVAEYRS